MSKETEDALRRWNTAALIEDDVHLHMDDYGRWLWCDVANEGRRIWHIMFDEEVASGSAIDAIISGVAARSALGAFSAVAAALGVDASALEEAVDAWYDNQDNPPKPIGPEKLMSEIAECSRFRNAEIS